MLVRMSRLQDVDGLPKVQPKTPQDFFSDVEKEDCGNLCRWRGELYLELHNGTYTTHAKVKIYFINILFLQCIHTLKFIFILINQRKYGGDDQLICVRLLYTILLAGN